MKLAIAADHAGYPLKEEVRGYLERLGHDVIDLHGLSAPAKPHQAVRTSQLDGPVGHCVGFGVLYIDVEIGVGVLPLQLRHFSSQRDWFCGVVFCRERMVRCRGPGSDYREQKGGGTDGYVSHSRISHGEVIQRTVRPFTGRCQTELESA